MKRVEELKISDSERRKGRRSRGGIDDKDVDQIFNLKQIGEKEQEKKRRVCGFYGPGEGI